MRDALLYGTISVITALVVCTVLYTLVLQERWEIFKVEHQCKHTQTALVAAPMPHGQRAQAAVNGWACNDGVTYWR